MGRCCPTPPYSIATHPHITEPAQTQLGSKFFFIPGSVLMSFWDPQKLVLGSQITWRSWSLPSLTLTGDKWFEGLDEVKMSALSPYWWHSAILCRH